VVARKLEFPRSRDRGPIEAFLLLPVWLIRHHFRDHVIAAPLKPVEGFFTPAPTAISAIT